MQIGVFSCPFPRSFLIKMIFVRKDFHQRKHRVFRTAVSRSLQKPNCLTDIVALIFQNEIRIINQCVQKPRACRLLESAQIRKRLAIACRRRFLKKLACFSLVRLHRPCVIRCRHIKRAERIQSRRITRFSRFVPPKKRERKIRIVRYTKIITFCHSTHRPRVARFSQFFVCHERLTLANQRVIGRI